jgi:hypothetical protein
VDTVLGLIGFVAFVAGVIGLAAGISWVVVRVTPTPKAKRREQTP